MILRSDLDPVCPRCSCTVGVKTWPAPPGVSGFCAAMQQHDRVTSTSTSWWVDPYPIMTREVCPGSGQPPRVMR